MTTNLTRIVPYLLTISANIFFVIGNSCLKQLASTFTLYQLNCYMNATVLLLTLIYCYFKCADLFLNVHKNSTFILLIIRTLFATTSIMFMLYNYISIPLSFASTLHNLAPLFLLFLQSFYYKLPLQKMHLIFTLISFLGVLLILKPDTIFKSSAQQREGLGIFVLIGVFQAFCQSASYLVLKEVKKEESVDHTVVLNYLYIINTILSGVLMNFQSAVRPLNLEIWMLAPFCIMIFAVMMGQNLNYKSLFLGDPTLVLPFSYSGIVASIFADFYIFGENIDALDLIGIILTSVGLICKLFIP